MSALQVTATFTIHDGKLDDFESAAAACMASVREKDSGTSQYDWFFNEDQSVCVFGEPSAKLVEASAGLGPTIYSPFQSI